MAAGDAAARRRARGLHDSPPGIRFDPVQTATEPFAQDDFFIDCRE